ncbi:MAG: DUF4230 domain-containing protein [Prevotella sp.]|nr:DUF4230 domain-containing protein [Prevotella sp.]
MMKIQLTKLVNLMVGCMVALMLCSCSGNDVTDADLKTIRDCKELEVAEFNFHKIIVERSKVRLIALFGYGVSTPEKTLILPVDVKVVGKVDFSNVSEENLITDGDELTFILPDPTLRIVSLKPDYTMRGKASREQWYRGGKFSDEELKKVANQAKDSIMTEKALRLMVERTRANAASTLIPVISLATGVPEHKITVRFDSSLDLSAPQLRDGNTIIFRRMD